MADPERIEHISIHVDPESVPEPGPCPLCGSEMKKVLAVYELRGNPVVVRNTVAIPGYECTACGAPYFDSASVLDLDREALKKLPRSSKLRGPLKESIARLSRALAEQGNQGSA